VPHATPARLRFDRVDALRGAAIVWMTAYHFSFDLDHFGWIEQDFFNDPFWTWQRTCIVSLFLFCAGLGQAIAREHGQSWRRFWRRWAQIAACALLVTIGSLWMFPGSFIYFGVLHGIAVMLVLVRLTAGWGAWLWPAGAVALALPWVAQDSFARWPEALEFLNARAFNWLGWVSRKPPTQDYVPLLPWLGVMWWGMAAGQWLLRHRTQWMQGALPRPLAPLAWMGRWSLAWYMVHQPLLIGLMMLAR